MGSPNHIRLRPPIRPRFAAIAAGLALALAASPPARAQEAAPVGVVAMQPTPIARSATFVGRVRAVERVDLRARVTGFLKEVLFTEGSLVQQGQILYRIEPDVFAAAVQMARGDLLHAQAVFANADIALKRAEELVKTAATPVATRDQRAADQKSAQGDIVAADAALRKAQIDLGYTEITAPIAGKIGRTSVTPGNVVGPDSGVLATIVRVDPIYVIFPVSQTQYLDVQRKEEVDPASLVVRLRFADGSVYDHTGTINFVDVTVDKTTDTITIRATFPNPKGLLIDGAYVQVSVEAGKPQDELVVPQSALLIDQEGPYVFVAQDGKAVVRRLRLGAEQGAGTVVDSGLKAGDLVIATGLQTLRPGQPVTPQPLPPPPAANGT